MNTKEQLLILAINLLVPSTTNHDVSIQKLYANHLYNTDVRFQSFVDSVMMLIEKEKATK